MTKETTSSTLLFLESQLNLDRFQVMENLEEYATLQITNLLKDNKHYNLNHVKLSIVLNAPPHLAELTKTFLISLNRAVFNYDYAVDPKKLGETDEIKLKMYFSHRFPSGRTIGLVKIDKQKLEKHIHYLREHDALYNSMFTPAIPPAYNKWDVYDYFDFSYKRGLSEGFHRFPLIDSLVHHKIPSSIVYFTY